MIIITGASDGVGLQVAKLYQQAGKKVVNISRRASEYADINIQADLTQGNEIIRAANEVKALDEPLEAIINAAGVWTEEAIGSISEDEVKRTMASNVKSVIMFTSELIDRIKQDETDILNIISTAGTEQVAQGSAVYTASKWAARGYTKSLQLELKPTKCRVISFCPGGINTDFFEKNTTRRDGQENWMKPEDIAGLIKQLLDLPKNMQVSEIIVNRN